MDTVDLEYMIVPEDLEKCGRVKDRVMLLILDADSSLLDGRLGESGKKLAEAGVRWYFKLPIANKLIEAGVAEMVVLEESDQEFYEWWRQLKRHAAFYDWDEDSLGDKESYRTSYEDGFTPKEAFMEMNARG